jgi:hypothetical protein
MVSAQCSTGGWLNECSRKSDTVEVPPLVRAQLGREPVVAMLLTYRLRVSFGGIAYRTSVRDKVQQRLGR